jgi:cell division protein FtsZ
LREWNLNSKNTELKRARLMNDKDHLPASRRALPRLPLIKVIGIGCGACNVVNHLFKENIKDVEFIKANTQSHSTKAQTFINLGKSTTKGLGTGMKPELGRESAENETEQIKNALENTDLLILISTLGGGTGSGSSPVIAMIASEMDILTISLVTTPFGFEGRKRMRFAQQCIEQLSQHVSLLLAISNNSLLSLATKSTTLKDSFSMVDDVLVSIISGISKVLTFEGIINLDYSDLMTIMSEKGRGLIGIGVGTGENRVEDAVGNALDSPLLENSSIQGGRGVIVNIIGDREITILDAEKAVDLIRQQVDDEANIIFGFAVEETKTDAVEITVIIAGCN